MSPGGFRPASSTATWLAGALPASAAVVKAFNNLSAYTLIHGDPLTEHMKSVAASDSPEAAAATAELGRAMGLEVRPPRHAVMLGESASPGCYLCYASLRCCSKQGVWLSLTCTHGAQPGYMVQVACAVLAGVLWLPNQS